MNTYLKTTFIVLFFLLAAAACTPGPVEPGAGGLPTAIVVTNGPTVPTREGPTPTVAVFAPTATKSPATNPAPTSTPSPTAVVVLSTDVQYVQAQTDVNLRAGPGTGYDIVGWVADGMAARVTGVSSDGGWWRVVCPDDTDGCWVTALTQYTRPTAYPVPPTPTVDTCSNAATFVADLSVPDGSQFPPVTPFVKSWRLRNSGTCTWDAGYRLVHDSGHTLGTAATAFALPAVVAPGQTIDLSINLITPPASGDYQSYWKLQDAKGRRFGVGADQNGAIWTKIVVAQSSTASFRGWVWHDYCQVLDDSDKPALAGNCVPDGQGGYRADGMIQEEEGYIAGVTVRLQAGACATDNPNILATAVTDANGKYTFSGLPLGTYCIFVSANEPANSHLLLPGGWTYPQLGIWYQQLVILSPGEQNEPVNFGWDYE